MNKVYKYVIVLLFVFFNIIITKNSLGAIKVNKNNSFIQAYEAANKGLISLKAVSEKGLSNPKVSITNHTNSRLNIDLSHTAFLPDNNYQGQRLGITGLASLKVSVPPKKSKDFIFRGVCLDKNRLTEHIKLTYSYLPEAIPDSISDLLNKNATQEDIWSVTEGKESTNWKSMDPRNEELFKKRKELKNSIYIKSKDNNLYEKILSDLINNKDIKSISLSENGGSTLISEDNSIWRSNLPKDVEKEIKDLEKKNSRINSVSFNKNNDWVILHDRNNASYSPKIDQKLKETLKYIKDKNFPITKFSFSPNGGWIITYGSDSIAYSNFPEEVAKFIEDLTTWGIKVKTIGFTKDYGWIVVFGKDNSFAYNNLPTSINKKIDNLVKKNKTIKNVAFSNSGDWVITEK